GRKCRRAGVGDLEILIGVEPEEVHHRLGIGRRGVRLRQDVRHPFPVAGDRLIADGAPARVVLDAERLLGLSEGEGRQGEKTDSDDARRARQLMQVVHGPSSKWGTGGTGWATVFGTTRDSRWALQYVHATRCGSAASARSEALHRGDVFFRQT